MQKSILGPLAMVVALTLLGGLLTSTALAYESFYGSRCASCHGAGNTTCDGCHRHTGVLSATTDQDAYTPGSPMVVTLHGGRYGGWIGAILYDEHGELVVYVAGQEFPVDLPATAPTDGT